MIVYLGVPVVSGEVLLFNPLVEPSNLGVVPPTFISSFSVSVVEGNTSVGTFPATTTGGGTVAYSLTSTTGDHSLFTINSTTGAVSFASAPDFEVPLDAGTNNVYDVNVVATNAAGSTSTPLTITVNNVLEGTAVTVAPTLALNVAESTSGTLATITPSAGSGPFSYALGGADAARFAITSGGALSFVATPDFEAPVDAGANNVYNLTVTVSNSVPSQASTVVTVTVTDVADIAPTMPATASFNVAEDTTAVGTITATAGTAPITYTLTGTDAGRFSVNSSTGVVAFTSAPDFEAPTDVGANNIYNFSVVATNTFGSASTAVTVTVTNVADVAPTMAATASFNVAENTTAVGTVAASAGTTPITYTLTGADAARFAVNTSGVVTFNVAPNFEAPTDVGANNVYNVNVVATNAFGTASTAVTVTVTDVADVPVTMPATATFNVAENTTSVGTVVATAGTAPITYTITGADVARFTVNASTGAVAFASAPNFEAPNDTGTNNVYNINVVGTNAFGNASTAVTITVTDIADTPVSMPTTATFNVNEGVTAVGTVVADSGSPTITYSLTGADAGRFSVTSGGVVTFTSAPDFEAPTDVGANNVYNFNVVGTNAFGSGSTAVTVTVVNVADVAPAMATTASFNVNEDTTAIGTVAASAGTAPITYTMTGTDAAHFSVVSSTGVLSFAMPHDFEAPMDAGANNVYNVNVVATNAFGSASTAVTVTVLNVADVPPTMPATASFNVVENTTAVGNIVATAGSTPITYTLSGTDAILFTINSSTGVVAFASAPNFEAPSDAGTNNVYNFSVVGTNGFGSASTAVTVTVTDVADNSVVMPATASFNVNENNTAVGTVTATAGTTPSYSLTGADASLFSITSGGIITFNNPPDFELPGDIGANNVYNFNVVGSNAFGPNAQTAVTVTVVDASESVAVVMPATATFNVNENTTTIGAAPVATAGTTPITYSLTGADADKITLTGGNLVFNVAPDFENPSDAGANNVFNVNVVATNNGGANTASTAVTITVVNVAESIAPTIAPTASFNVNENSTVIGTVTAISGTAPISYAVSGPDANRVSINSTTGAITFNVGPNYELPVDNDTNNVYNFNVIANNITNSPAVCAVTVTVVNVFEDVTPAQFSYTTQTNASLSTQYQATASITSVEDGVPITFSNCEISTNNGASWVSTGTPAYVTGQTLARATVMSAGVEGGSAYVDVTVLGVTARFTVNNVPAPGAVQPSFAAPFTFTIDENTTTVGLVAASTGTAPITYSLSGSDASKFSVSSGGVLTWVAPPDFEAPTDVGTNNVYNVNVIATNAGGQAVGPVTITVRNVVEDTTPNALVVNTTLNAGVNQPIESSTFTVAGIDIEAQVVLDNISGLEVAVNTGSGFGAWTTNNQTLSAGTTFKFRKTSSSLYDTLVSGSFEYAGVPYTWQIRTINPDMTITPIALATQTVSAGTTYTSQPVQISGADNGVDLPVVAGGNLYWSVNRGAGYEPFVNTSGNVQNGNYVRFRMDAPANPSTNNQTETAVGSLTIAGSTVSLTLHAALASYTPRTVILGSRTSQATNQEVFSEIAIINDLSPGIQIGVAVADGSIRFDTGSGFGAWIDGGSAQLENGDSFQVKHTTDASPGRNVSTTVSYGTKIAYFTSSTGARDDTLSPVMLVNRDSVMESTTILSNEVIIDGINVTQDIRVVGCTYSVNGGAATSANGTVVNGDKVVFSVQSSETSEGVKEASISLGKDNYKWRVTTRVFSSKPTNIRLPSKVDQALNTPTVLRMRLTGISAGISVVGTNVELSNDNGMTWGTTPVPMVVGSTYFRVTVPGSSNYSRRTSVTYTINGVTETVFAFTRRDPSTPKPRIESAATRAAKRLV